MILNSRKYTLILGMLLFLAGVALFAYLGLYNRYWADDWCFNADLKDLGFLDTLKGYSYITTYSANRFSMTLFSGVLNFFGLLGVQIMTPLFIILWFTGLYWILENLRVFFTRSLTPLHTLFATVVIIYYSIYLAPHMYQSIYWQSALLPYTAPTVFGVWVFALITFQAQRPEPLRWLNLLTAVIAFLAGGFSEAGCATLTSILVVFILVCHLNRRKEWAKNSMPSAVFALFAAVFAMVLLIVSPTVIYRLGLYDERPLSVLEYPMKLMFNTFDFIKYSFLDAPYPSIIFILTFGLVGFLSNTLEDRRIENKTLILSFLFIGFLTFLFVAASYAPSALIEKAPPAPRTRIISIFILMLGVSAFAGLLGYYLKQIFGWKSLEITALILLLMTYMYDARTVLISAQKISIYAERASIWDERDLQIKQAKEQGILEVHVRAIDGRAVGGIRDFDDGPPGGFWINQCAARYYGVDAIYATGP